MCLIITNTFFTGDFAPVIPPCLRLFNFHFHFLF